MRSHRALFGVAGLVLAAVFVPWMLFGDVVPDFLQRTFSPRFLGAVLVGVLVLIGAGAYRWVKETGADDDPARARKRSVLAALAIALLGLVVAAAITGGHFYSHARASDPCRAAERANTVAERERLLEEARPWRERVALLNERVSSCDTVERELSALRERGECPRLVPRDARCTCGAESHPADWPAATHATCDYDYSALDRNEPLVRRLVPRADYELPDRR